MAKEKNYIGLRTNLSQWACRSWWPSPRRECRVPSPPQRWPSGWWPLPPWTGPTPALFAPREYRKGQFDPREHKKGQFAPREYKKQCCGTGSVRSRNFWPDPDPIRIRNKHFGSETGSETNLLKGVFFSGQKRKFQTIKEYFKIFKE